MTAGVLLMGDKARRRTEGKTKSEEELRLVNRRLDRIDRRLKTLAQEVKVIRRET